MNLIIIIALIALLTEVTYLVFGTIKKEQRTSSAPVFIDTSVLIDGRIIAVAESGFMNRPLYIPRSVVGELQLLADTGDTEKRTRARHGLDIINELQSISSVNVVVFPDGVRAEEGVDNRLISLAKKHGGAICTIDYNLNKVAVVEGIQVLNVNELTKSLRMDYLPGERLVIELAQKGNDSHQGVGHLPDGTMVVVEHASKYIGSKVEVEFTRALQTAAGKMMFARLTSSVGDSSKEHSSKEQYKAHKTQRPVSQPKLAAVDKSIAAKSKPYKRQPKQSKQVNNIHHSNEESMVELANRKS